MNKYKETFKTWNKVAALYEDKFMDMDLYNKTYDTFCQLIKNENPKILEIGCGPGNITKYLLSKRPDFNILGLDIAPNMIELAIKNNPTAQFNVMDIREIDSLKTKFDAIICGFALPYLSKEDRLKLIGDCKKLLSINGVLYLSFIEGEYKNSGLQIGPQGDKMYVYYHEQTNLIAELKSKNFKPRNISEIVYPKEKGQEMHTVIIAKSSK